MAVDTIALCTPQNAMRTATAPPNIVFVGTPAVQSLAFDDTTDETEYWLGWMPEDYGSGGLTVEILWTIESTSGNNFGAEVGFARLEDGVTDLDAPGFAANNVDAWEHNGASGVVNQDAITFTNGADMDSIGAGEFFLVRLVRDASVGTDLTGDVLVLGMVIRET